MNESYRIIQSHAWISGGTARYIINRNIWDRREPFAFFEAVNEIVSILSTPKYTLPDGWLAVLSREVPTNLSISNGLVFNCLLSQFLSLLSAERQRPTDEEEWLMILNNNEISFRTMGCKSSWEVMLCSFSVLLWNVFKKPRKRMDAQNKIRVLANDEARKNQSQCQLTATASRNGKCPCPSSGTFYSWQWLSLDLRWWWCSSIVCHLEQLEHDWIVSVHALAFHGRHLTPSLSSIKQSLSAFCPQVSNSKSYNSILNTTHVKNEEGKGIRSSILMFFVAGILFQISTVVRHDSNMTGCIFTALC